MNCELNVACKPLGFTYEVCAGIVDKEGLSLADIASEEVLEECGYHVEPSELQYVSSYNSSIGISGSSQHIYFAEVG